MDEVDVIDMIETSELLPLLRRKIPGPLDLTLCEALQSAAVIFCRESTICRQSIILHDIPAEQEQKVSTTGKHLIISRILEVTDMEKHRDYECGGNRITFHDAHPQAQLLCVMVPKLNGSYLPEILSDYAETLAHGALTDLHIMAGKPWFSADLSAYHKQLFTDGFRAAYRQTLNYDPVSGYNTPVREGTYY